MRSETRIREMQQSGPCALSCAFLERSLAAMLIQHAPPRLAVQHAITRFLFSGEAVSVIGYNVGALLTVGSDCVGRMELRRLVRGLGARGGKEASSRKQGW